MAPSTAILSQTLRSITVTKIRELQKQKNTYGVRKSKIQDTASKEKDLRKRVTILHENLKELQLWNKPEFRNIEKWTSQSQFDPSFPTDKLIRYETQLANRLDAETRKLELADLYSRLLTEWIEHNDTSNVDSQMLESSDGDTDSFELVQSAQRERLDQLREKFARVVFEPLETDEVEINTYLESLFSGDKSKDAMHRLQRETQQATRDLHELSIDHKNLLWTIQALQKNDLLNDEKKALLQDFLQDEAVLNEIRDVLNMRLKNIDSWSWDMGDEGMPVLPRQSLNGKWRVMVDDDIMQALLTQFVGTVWAVKLKNTFQNVTRYTGMWRQGSYESADDKKKRNFFSIVFDDDPGLEDLRKGTYQGEFFMAPLPSTQAEAGGGYDEEDTNTDKKSGKDIKQLLLRTLATEVLVRRAFDKEVAVVQSDFQWFATGIPHSTVFATLRFMGFEDPAIVFLKKVLEPPLDMLDGSPVKIRRRGLPMAHIFEKLFGEIVLFFMDIAVNQEASQILYRFHDDLWLVGKPDRIAQAWKAMEKFSKVMGLEFNLAKTGSVYFCELPGGKDQEIIDALPTGTVTMDFLMLDPDAGNWVINEPHVQKHVEQLGKQLSQAKSILEWITIWNSCIGRFFGYTFGEPAQCFGRPHLDSILETHQKMQQFLFDGRNGTGENVSAHLKLMISSRFSVPVDSIPDAFLYLPDSFGGLGLKNPFIDLCLVKEGLIKSPEWRLETYLKEEREAYNSERLWFDELGDRERRKRWREHFADDVDSDDPENNPPVLSKADAENFPTYEEYTANREVHSRSLRDVYETLMTAPVKTVISVVPELKTELEALQRAEAQLDGSDGEKKDPMEDKELLWLLSYYFDDLMRDFGGLRCVQKDLLPFGVLGAMRKKKVTWQMVL